MKYCHECGHQLNEDAVFCGECGSSQDGSKPAVNQTPLNTSPKPPSAPREPMENPLKKLTKTQKIIGMSLLITAVLLFSFYKIGENLTSKEVAIEKLNEAIVNDDKEAVANLLYSSDARLKIDEQTVDSLLAYIDDKPSYLSDLMASLDSQSKLIDEQKKNKAVANDDFFENFNSGSILTLKSVGKTGLVFDKYRFEVKPYYIQIRSNYPGSKIYLNEEEIFTLDENAQVKEYGPVLPGNYTVKAVYEGEYTTLENQVSIELFGNYDYHDVNVFLEGYSISAQSNYDDAILFINGKDTGKAVNEFGEFGPVPSDGSLELHAEKAFPWGTIRSDAFPVEQGNYYFSLDINPVNNQLKTDIMNIVNAHENQWTDAYSTNDATKFTHALPYLMDEYQYDIDFNSGEGLYYAGKGLSKTIYDKDSFNLYEGYDGETYLSVVVDTVYLGGWAHVEMEEEELQALITDEEEEHNMWRYSLMFNESDNKWYIESIDSVWYYEPTNSEEFSF